MEIKTTYKGCKEAVVVNYDFGADLSATVSLFGAEKVEAAAVGKFVIELQNFVRKHMHEGKLTADQIVELAKAWKPGVTAPRKPRKPAKDKFLESFAAMSPEQQAELLSQLQAKSGKSSPKAKAA